MERPLGLASFDGQSTLAHALTVAGALACFAVAYFGAVFLVYGDVSPLASEANVAHQRAGGVAGAIVVWAYFALAFVRGYGGPVLNALAYPLAIVLVVPFVLRWAMFGPDVAGLVSRFVGLFVFEPIVTAIVVVVPGIGTFVTILTLWAWAVDEDERRRWEREHLTEEFYEAFVAQDYE